MALSIIFTTTERKYETPVKVCCMVILATIGRGITWSEVCIQAQRRESIMSALDEIQRKTFTPEKMTALDWVIWNSRASLPIDLLEKAAEQLKLQTPRPPCPECGKDFSHYTGCSRGVEIRKPQLTETAAELLALRGRVEKLEKQLLTAQKTAVYFHELGHGVRPSAVALRLLKEYKAIISQ